ncbi:hypothetical protein Q9Q99_04275 [Curtobacterium flaccumfaciens]|nr:hypothetical protein Q9Q99_04275 [Curtobacterium flaccumfaciens]
MLAVVAAVALIGRSRLAIRMRLPQHRVAVGDEAGVIVTAENPTRLPSVPTTVEVPVGSGLVDVAIPAIGPQGTFERQVPVPTLRRGVLDVGPVTGVRADPVGPRPPRGRLDRPRAGHRAPAHDRDPVDEHGPGARPRGAGDDRPVAVGHRLPRDPRVHAR